MLDNSETVRRASEFLIQWVWGGAGEFAFLTSFRRCRLSWDYSLRTNKLQLNSPVHSLSGFCLFKTSRRALRKAPSPSSNGECALGVREHAGSVLARFGDLPRPPGPALQSGWMGVCRAEQQDLGAKGQGRWLSALRALLRPRIYVTGAQCLKPRGQRGIWVNGK